MANIPYRINRAQERLQAAGNLARIVWCINLAAAVISLAYNRYELAAIAGFTFLATLSIAGMARKASRFLKPIERACDSPKMAPVIEETMAA